MSGMWDAVSGIAAALSVLGGGVAWWRSAVSRTARDEARAERERAERAVIAAEKHATHAGEAAEHLAGVRTELGSHSESLGKLAASTDEAPFRIEFVQGHMYRLLNRTTTEETLGAITNRADIAILKDLPDGTVLPARNGVTFRMMAANGRPLPATMVLELVGASGPTYVDVPVRPQG